MRCAWLVCLVLLCCVGCDVINETIVADWAQKISDTLTDVACQYLLVGGKTCPNHAGFQDVYNAMSKDPEAYDIISKNGTELVIDIASVLGDLFDRRANIAKSLRDRMEESFAAKARPVNLKLRDINNEPAYWFIGGHPDMNISAFEKFIQESDEFAGAPVTFEFSGMQYPTLLLDIIEGRVDSPETRIKDVFTQVNASAFMNDVFRKNRAENEGLKWQYFGSATGFSRLYPAVPNPDDIDIRFMPWYSSVSHATTQVVFLLDSSESMSVNNRLDIARGIIDTVMSSLTASDFATIVQMNTGGQTHNCFPQRLVALNQANKDELRNYLRSLPAGSTANFDEGFRKSVELLNQTSSFVSKDCLKFVFLLTDGIIEWPQSDYRQLIEQYAPGTRIMAFSVGGNAELDVPLTLSCATGGLFHHIEKPKTPTGYMQHLYGFYQMIAAPLAHRSEEVTWSPPYVDPLGLGLMVTATLPCFGDLDTPSPTFLGVVGVDLLLQDIITEMKTLSLVPNTYLSVLYINGIAPGLTLVHPKQVDPLSPSVTDQSFMDITQLEGDAFLANKMKQRVLSGGGGTASFVDTRIPPRVSDIANVNVKVENVTYHWQQIGDHALSVMLVTTGQQLESVLKTKLLTFKELRKPASVNCDASNSPVWDATVNTTCREPLQVHNRIDLFRPPEVGAKAFVLANTSLLRTFDTTTYKVVSRAHNDFKLYSTTREDAKAIAALHQYLNNASSSVSLDSLPGRGFKGQVMSDLQITSMLESAWKKVRADILEDIPDYAYDYFVGTPLEFGDIFFVYVATYTLFRSFPGQQVGQFYDPVLRPWFRAAVELPGVLLVTPPYESSSTGLTLVTLTHTVHLDEPRDKLGAPTTDVEAVMGLDYLFPKFTAVIFSAARTQVPFVGCHTHTVRCYLIDKSALLVLHPDFAEHGYEPAAPVFLGEKEPGLTQQLLAASFLTQQYYEDPSRNAVFNVYSANDDVLPVKGRLTGAATGFFFVDKVAHTNLFLIVIDDYKSDGWLPVCGPLSLLCPDVQRLHKNVLVSDICEFEKRLVASEIRPCRALAASGSDHVSLDMLSDRYHRLFSCPAELPDWLQYVIIAVFVTIALIFFATLIRQRLSRYWRSHRPLSKSQKLGRAFHLDSAAVCTSRDVSSEEQENVRKLMNYVRRTPQDWYDLLYLVEMQSRFMDHILAKKQRALRDLHCGVNTLKCQILEINRVSVNLYERLLSIDTKELQSYIAGLKVAYDADAALFRKRMEELHLPAVHVPQHDNNLRLTRTVDVSERSDRSVGVHYRDFYQHMYPHLFSFDTSVHATFEDSTEMDTSMAITDHRQPTPMSESTRQHSATPVPIQQSSPRDLSALPQVLEERPRPECQKTASAAADSGQPSPRHLRLPSPRHFTNQVTRVHSSHRSATAQKESPRGSKSTSPTVYEIAIPTMDAPFVGHISSGGVYQAVASAGKPAHRPVNLPRSRSAVHAHDATSPHTSTVPAWETAEFSPLQSPHHEDQWLDTEMSERSLFLSHRAKSAELRDDYDAECLGLDEPASLLSGADILSVNDSIHERMRPHLQGRHPQVDMLEDSLDFPVQHTIIGELSESEGDWDSAAHRSPPPPLPNATYHGEQQQLQPSARYNSRRPSMPAGLPVAFSHSGSPSRLSTSHTRTRSGSLESVGVEGMNQLDDPEDANVEHIVSSSTSASTFAASSDLGHALNEAFSGYQPEEHLIRELVYPESDNESARSLTELTWNGARAGKAAVDSQHSRRHSPPPPVHQRGKAAADEGASQPQSAQQAQQCEREVEPATPAQDGRRLVLSPSGSGGATTSGSLDTSMSLQHPHPLLVERDRQECQQEEEGQASGEPVGAGHAMAHSPAQVHVGDPQSVVSHKRRSHRPQATDLHSPASEAQERLLPLQSEGMLSGVDAEFQFPYVDEAGAVSMLQEHASEPLDDPDLQRLKVPRLSPIAEQPGLHESADTLRAASLADQWPRPVATNRQRHPTGADPRAAPRARPVPDGYSSWTAYAKDHDNTSSDLEFGTTESSAKPSPRIVSHRGRGMLHDSRS